MVNVNVEVRLAIARVIPIQIAARPKKALVHCPTCKSSKVRCTGLSRTGLYRYYRCGTHDRNGRLVAPGCLDAEGAPLVFKVRYV